MSDSSTFFKSCSVDGCDRKHKAKGLCSAHYKRRNKNNMKPVSNRVRGVCSVDSCDLPHSSLGFCKSHAERARRGASLDVPLVKQRTSCSVEGCGRKHEAKGFCKLHSDRLKRGTPLNQPVEVQIHGRTSCSVQDCDNDYAHSGFCSKHIHIHKTYKLSAEQIYALPNFCMVCGSTNKLFVDHDHSCCSGDRSCGECVRGVLCRNCNLGLGFLQDNIDVMELAIKYLKKDF